MRVDRLRMALRPESQVTMTEDQIFNAVEKFASTPRENGRYPTDDACDEYEKNLRRFAEKDRLFAERQASGE